MEELITLPKTLLYYNVFVVPLSLVERIRLIIRESSNYGANVVVSTEEAELADSMLSGVIDEVLRVGSPVEFILTLHSKALGLPDGAAKHLLWFDSEEDRARFADLLRSFADICPPKLPA